MDYFFTLNLFIFFLVFIIIIFFYVNCIHSSINNPALRTPLVIYKEAVRKKKVKTPPFSAEQIPCALHTQRRRLGYALL